jgi:hypothetical protein
MSRMSGLEQVHGRYQLDPCGFKDLLVSQYDWYVCFVEPQELAQRLSHRGKFTFLPFI